MNANNQRQKPILTFRLADQYYALPIMNVLEVAAMMNLTQIPDAPEAIQGIANRHGEALPIIDLRLAFKVKATPLDISTLFIVAQSGETRVGLIVDEIFQVRYVPESAIKSVQGAGRYITHMISDDEKIFQQMALNTFLTDYLEHIQS